MLFGTFLSVHAITNGSLDLRLQGGVSHSCHRRRVLALYCHTGARPFSLHCVHIGEKLLSYFI